jgi:hypothetical protein
LLGKIAENAGPPEKFLLDAPKLHIHGSERIIAIASI